ncbi:hypothetical protein QTO34_007856 [Cnephaeus nilssonii]|uniref:Receptor-interacting serine/threonine-protein kinase 2 n=1 Tax=Cnephaeus nilssonii TaxID=3371016 RepID=A0AA40HJ31_CNENI|nr:hypothetical protein QTO34_007856 [Eptesicus nilssonii]
MSLSQSRNSKAAPEGGTIIYMPPENYEPGQKARASVKHDIYSYAVIMWEVLSRKQPFEDVTNPLQIMYSVSQGHRPDTSEESLPPGTPHRARMVSLIEGGWAQNPDERPSFLKCLIELEPVLRTYEEITFLEAVLQLKKTKVQSDLSAVRLGDKKSEVSLNLSLSHSPQEESCGSFQRHRRSSSPGAAGFLSAPQHSDCASGVHAARAAARWTLLSSPAWPVLPGAAGGAGTSSQRQCCLSGKTQDRSALLPRPASHSWDDVSAAPTALFCDQETAPCSLAIHPLSAEGNSERSQPGVAQQWIQSKREDVVSQMTEACLNQALDALLSRDLIMKEDYELISTKPTRTAKVRQLLDTTDIQGEGFARVIVQKLKDNKQMGLQPYPDMLPASRSPSLLLIQNKSL